MESIRKICGVERVPGVKTTVTFGASHPSVDLNGKSQKLLDLALEISAEQGQRRYHEKTGGAGDIAIAGLAGIGVLDGLGLAGEKMHTTDEYVFLDSIQKQIDFAAEMIVRVPRLFS